MSEHTDPHHQDTPPPATVEADDLIGQAITALSAAARQQRVIGEGTPNERRVPADFAEIACHVLTCVAANLGSVETLLAGRWGSWEADLVRQAVHGTAGYEEGELVRWRTEPVRVFLDVDVVFQDFGLWELYEEADREATAREQDAEEALIEAVATPAEKARLTQIGDETWGILGGDEAEIERQVTFFDEARGIWEAVIARAEADADAGHAPRAEVTAAGAAVVALETLWEQDRAAYRLAYLATIRRHLDERGLALLPIVDSDDLTDLDAGLADPFVANLTEHALAATPLPMTHAAPDWTDGDPADALRRAGLTYTARTQQEKQA